MFGILPCLSSVRTILAWAIAAAPGCMQYPANHPIGMQLVGLLGADSVTVAAHGQAIGCHTTRNMKHAPRCEARRCRYHVRHPRPAEGHPQTSAALAKQLLLLLAPTPCSVCGLFMRPFGRSGDLRGRIAALIFRRVPWLSVGCEQPIALSATRWAHVGVVHRSIGAVQVWLLGAPSCVLCEDRRVVTICAFIVSGGCRNDSVIGACVFARIDGTFKKTRHTTPEVEFLQSDFR